RAEPAKKRSLTELVIVPALSAFALEEIFDAREETGALRARLLMALALELFQQIALFLGQALRRFHLYLDVHVAVHLGAQHRHALALQAELLAALGALGDLDARCAALDGRHLDLAAERRGSHRDRHFAEDVGAVALEELV